MPPEDGGGAVGATLGGGTVGVGGITLTDGVGDAVGDTVGDAVGDAVGELVGVGLGADGGVPRIITPPPPGVGVGKTKFVFSL